MNQAILILISGLYMQTLLCFYQAGPDSHRTRFGSGWGEITWGGPREEPVPRGVCHCTPIHSYGHVSGSQCQSPGKMNLHVEKLKLMRSDNSALEPTRHWISPLHYLLVDVVHIGRLLQQTLSIQTLYQFHDILR